MKINFQVYGTEWKGYIFSRLHGWDLVWFSYNYSTSRFQRYQKETIRPYSEMPEKARDLMKCWMILWFFFSFWKFPQNQSPSIIVSYNRSQQLCRPLCTWWCAWTWLTQATGAPASSYLDPAVCSSFQSL